jgi:hypothetical protein
VDSLKLKKEFWNILIYGEIGENYELIIMVFNDTFMSIICISSESDFIKLIRTTQKLISIKCNRLHF